MTTEPITPDQRPEGWDAIVANYEAAVEPGTAQFVAPMLDRAGVGPGTRLLDVAAGPGVLTFEAARRGAQVLAIDFSPAMVARLRQRAAESPVPGVTAEVMDAQALALRDSEFDAICSNFGAIFFPDPVQGFREMRRVLKPGGRAVVTSWPEPARQQVAQVMMQAVRAALPPDITPRPPVWLQFQDPDVLRTAMLQAGFTAVSVETIPGEWHMPSVAWARENLVNMAPATQVLFDGLTPAQREVALDHIAKSLTERFGDAPPVLHVEAHIAVAVNA